MYISCTEAGCEEAHWRGYDCHSDHWVADLGHAWGTCVCRRIVNQCLRSCEAWKTIRWEELTQALEEARQV